MGGGHFFVPPHFSLSLLDSPEYGHRARRIFLFFIPISAPSIFDLSRIVCAIHHDFLRWFPMPKTEMAKKFQILQHCGFWFSVDDSISISWCSLTIVVKRRLFIRLFNVVDSHPADRPGWWKPQIPQGDEKNKNMFYEACCCWDDGGHNDARWCVRELF